MTLAPLKTISGRIAVGFFVLTATIAAVSAYVTHKMHDIGRELGFIRAAYVEVLLHVTQLQSMQGQVVDYLDSTERLDPRLRPAIDTTQARRRQILEQIEKLVAELGPISAQHRAAISDVAARAGSLREAFRETEALYERAFLADLDAAAAKAALENVEQAERKLLQRQRQWFVSLRGGVQQRLSELERAGEGARTRSLALGGLAIFVGLLVTIWAILTLRPLRRLRDGARRIARGEYHERVAVGGQTEVSEVAKEFNAMAEAVQQREQELVRSARLAAIGKMASVITHELRNPLSSIGLNAELLEEELVNEGGSDEAKSLCRTIHREVDRLTGITEEYLRFARMPRPKLDLEQINVTIVDLLEFLRSELDKANVTVTRRLSDDLPLVLVDEGQLRQAFLNLIRNSVEAMAAEGGGTLTIVTERLANGSVVVRVADTGPGVATSHRAHVFEPFFSTKDGGTGLGLALTQQIIAEHGGSIRLDDALAGAVDGRRAPEVLPVDGEKPCRGTTFVIELPAS